MFRQYSSFLRTLTNYASVLRKLVKDSIFRFRKDFILILITGVSGSFFQIAAIGQVVYFSRMFDKGNTFTIRGYDIDPRSVDFFILSMAVLLLLLLISSFLIYYSNSKIIKLACTYEAFCSKKVYSIIACRRGLVSPGLLSLYDDAELLKLTGRGPRFCGRILRLLIILVQPTVTFIIALGSLFYIDVLLTVTVLLVTGGSMFFHYRNNLKGASSSQKMFDNAPGASKEKRTILKTAMRLNHVSHDFFKWLDSCYVKGKIKDNLDGYRNRFQTMEDAKLINDLLFAVLLTAVASILGGKAIIQKAHWGSLIVYLLALRYCLNHLNKIVVTFTSINRFYPIFSRHFYFIDSFEFPEPQKEFLTRRYKIHVESSPFEGSASSLTIKNGDILALGSTFQFNFYDIPNYLKCLFVHDHGSVEDVLRSTNVIAETNGYVKGLSFRELFGFPQNYDIGILKLGLKDHGISEEMISRLPQDLNRPILRKEWDDIETDDKYTLCLLSAIHSRKQWIVVDRKVLEHLPRTTRGHLFRKLGERIILIIFDGEIDHVGRYGETKVAIIDDQNLIGLGDIHWFKNQKKNIQQKIDSEKKHLSQVREKEEDEDDEDDDDI
jgi:hypothetical protein